MLCDSDGDFKLRKKNNDPNFPYTQHNTYYYRNMSWFSCLINALWYKLTFPNIKVPKSYFNTRYRIMLSVAELNLSWHLWRSAKYNKTYQSLYQLTLLQIVKHEWSFVSKSVYNEHFIYLTPNLYKFYVYKFYSNQVTNLCNVQILMQF